MVAFRRDDENRAGATRRVAQRWLREVLFEEWGLKLLALAITLGLWYGVTSQRAPVTISLRGVQLYFMPPDNVEISNNPREEVEVTLQGRRNELNDLVVGNLVATVDVSRYKLGERVISLTPETVSMNLPEGVRIEKIEPSRAPVRLERRVEREVDVKARLEGSPPEGYELLGVQITPSKVRVRGPESRVNELQSVPTETISLDGQLESLTLPQTAIDIEDRKVVALDQVVTVRVEIDEERIEKRFAGVTVRAANGGAAVRPASVSVVLRGARSVMEKLRAESLEIILEQTEGNSLSPRLLLPQDMQGRVELLSTTPAAFTILK
ncbi:MAG: CdaR family protein [Pyrinomonadaceae bacterium]